MNDYKGKSVAELIGDFYQGHANNDNDQMASALDKLQNLLFTGQINSDPFKEYFNDIFSGRTAYNTLLAVNDYPKESIIRELLQNTFGCYYREKDMKVVFNFKQNDEISISYNEVGFNMEQFLYYLSFGRNDGDVTREGRFGVGAKSVFMNVESLSLRSNNFSFKIKNQNGVLKIVDLNLMGALFKGTEIIIKVHPDEYQNIRDNLLTITEQKGDYINLVELAFAFNRKKVLDVTNLNHEALDRTINVAVMEDGKLSTVYKIIRNQKTPQSTPTIRFMQNGKSVIDFICYENEGYVYLIPFAVATAKREGIVKVLLEKYNFFSTYELTGLLKVTGESIVDEKLSAFFISVPNTLVTSHRTGIRHDRESEVSKKLERDLTAMIEQYSEYFVLELTPFPNSDKHFMHPKSYAFEFFKNFINTSRLAEKMRLKFQDSISVIFPGNPEPVAYPELQKFAFSSIKQHVPKSQHLDKTAYEKYIAQELYKMTENLADMENKIIYVAYEWESDDGTESGREYMYKFDCFNNISYVDSVTSASLTDYNLYYHFSSLINRLLDKYLVNQGVPDEIALQNALALFDDIYNEDYRIVMRYYQFYITHHNEQNSFDVSKMEVTNLKNAMDTMTAHQQRFDTHQNYNEAISLMVNSFTQGKDTMSFLREIKEQGGEITLQLDINKKYRFCAYGKQFMIPSSITNADMLEIIGEVHVLIKCGMLNGRTFDFPYTRGRYAFEKPLLQKFLGSDKITESYISDIWAKTYVCDLKTDRVALVDTDGKIIKIVEMTETITDEDRAKTDKYIILRDDYTKPEFADAVEFIITSKCDGALSRYYSSTDEPNQILPDQIPYYYKPIPNVTSEEFVYLRNICSDISAQRESNSYRSFFAKDINSKLFGYGGVCPVCGHKNDVINSYTIKDFEVGLLDNEKESNFVFSLYLCANDALAANGWMIDDVIIGGMSPFLWLDEIEQAKQIPAEFMFCSIKYRPQITYDVLGATDKMSSENVVTAPQQSLDIVLTPLMAAKWVEDNKRTPFFSEEAKAETPEKVVTKK